MDKKEYLIKLLTQLEPIWDEAKWLKILVEEWHLNDEILDVITQAVKWAVHTTKDELTKKKLEKSLSVVEKLKQLQAESKEKDEQDLAELDKMLEEI